MTDDEGICSGDKWEEWEDAVDDLVKAKKLEAEEFLRYRTRKDVTDGQAARMAYVATGGAVDIAQGRVDYIRRMLDGPA